MVAGGAGVDGGDGEPAYLGEEVPFGVVGEVVGGGEAEVGVDDDVGFGAQGVTDPADAQFPDVPDAGGGAQGAFGLVDQGRVDGVHQPGEDLAGRAAEHTEDCDGDDQPDDRVGEGEPEGDPAAPRSTARLVNPSVRACSPSATNAAEPIRRPTVMR